MRILDKYILKKVLYSYLLILTIFIGLHIIIELFSNLNDFLNSKIPFSLAIKYYIALLPLIFLRTSTLAIPVSILFSLGELNKNNELISIRSCGISIVRLSSPIIIFSIIISFFSLFIQEKILLYSQKEVEDIKLQYIAKYSQDKEENNLFFREKNYLFFVSKFSPQEKSLNDVIIFREDSLGNIKEKIVSRKIIYQNNQWQGYEVIQYQLDEQKRILDKPTFWEKKKIELNIDPKTIKFKKSTFSQYMSINSIRKEIEQIKDTQTPSTFFYNLVIDYHRKIAEPFSHLFLSLAVLPFALEIKRRKVGLSAISTGFIFGFTYYLLLSISTSLGKLGIIIPWLSCWVAPLAFSLIGITGIFLLQ
ncbi:MAG: LptF/LptG family permease [Candidatus Omnitrophica bacterium]|nr:LptF/LptG family permease [Candidatus Omnitrophota bacterium]MCM8827472.1 LptF/LptG family permease [Candidatus Omnitrophota bacterium]